jgi:hypothetical protein
VHEKRIEKARRPSRRCFAAYYSVEALACIDWLLTAAQG